MSSLSSAAAILRLFSAERPELTVSDVSRLLPIPKSSASRLLKSMLAEGLVATAAGAPGYRVGPLPFELSRLYVRQSALMDLVEAEMAALSRVSGHNAYVSILDGSHVVVLRVHFGTQTLRVVTPLGSRSAAFESANGRALLARLVDSEVRARHPRRLRPRLPTSPGTIDELLSALSAVRRLGYAEAIDEEVPGVGSIAVSVVDPDRGEAIGCCVAFPAATVCAAERQRLAAMLTAAAGRIGREVGDLFWTAPATSQSVAA